MQMKNQQISGFLVRHYADKHSVYLNKLIRHLQAGEIKPVIDLGSPKDPFLGVESVPRAIAVCSLPLFI